MTKALKKKILLVSWCDFEMEENRDNKNTEET